MGRDIIIGGPVRGFLNLWLWVLFFPVPFRAIFSVIGGGAIFFFGPCLRPFLGDLFQLFSHLRRYILVKFRGPSGVKILFSPFFFKTFGFLGGLQLFFFPSSGRGFKTQILWARFKSFLDG